MPKRPPKQPHQPESGVTKRLELEYEQAIRQIVAKVMPPKGSTPNLQKWLDSIFEKTKSPEIHRLTNRLAARMVRWVNVGNAKTWREAAARSQRSRMLYRLLQKEMAGPVGKTVRQLVAENAVLIRSIPLDAATITTREILALQQKGARPETIARALRLKLPQHTAARIRLISRTETMKASAALTEARATHLGVRAYIWRTSHDSRVRHSHAGMEDVIVLYSRPPAPEKLFPMRTKRGRPVRSTLGAYHAGNAPNDRCTQLPILSPNDVSWPHRVFDGTRVRQMTKAEFVEFAG